MAHAKGKLIEAPKYPMVYLHSGYGNTLPTIETASEEEVARQHVHCEHGHYH